VQGKPCGKQLQFACAEGAAGASATAARVAGAAARRDATGAVLAKTETELISVALCVGGAGAARPGHTLAGRAGKKLAKSATALTAAGASRGATR
jgi:hypothetical protein